MGRAGIIRSLLPAFFLTILVLLAGAARAAIPTGDEPDDPKLARRLKVRMAAPITPATGAAAAPAAAPASAPAPASLAASASVSPRTGGPEAVVAAPGPPTASAETLPAAGPREAGRTPTIGLGYRRFSFVQVGATDPGSASGLAASEPFDSVSLDFYPVSRFIRFGLSTQYGWQNGRFSAGNGDYFIAQSASLGIQHAGAQITPFAEAFAGGGYMRRFQFDRTIPTAYWQFGIDAGANFFLGDHGFLSLALGYLRPVNGFLKQQSFSSVYVDTWSVKVGFGI